MKLLPCLFGRGLLVTGIVINASVLVFFCGCRSAQPRILYIELNYAHIPPKEMDYRLNRESIRAMKKHLPVKSTITTISSEKQARIFIEPANPHENIHLQAVKKTLLNGLGYRSPSISVAQMRYLSKEEGVPRPEPETRKELVFELDHARLRAYGISDAEVLVALEQWAAAYKVRKIDVSRLQNAMIRIKDKEFRIAEITQIKLQSYRTPVVRTYTLPRFVPKKK